MDPVVKDGLLPLRQKFFAFGLSELQLARESINNVGYRREARSEGSVEQTCESMDKNRVQGVSIGRAGLLPRSPYPSRMRSVDPATVHGRRLSLPQEICSVSFRRLRMPRGILNAGQKSAEGVLGHAVGKASEALRRRKVESTDRLSRERGLKARTSGEASRT